MAGNDRMRKIKDSILMVVFALFSISLGAQEKVLHGIVTVYGNVPLTGVFVEVKSTGQIVETDTLGKFVVTCNLKDKLKIHSDGFYKQKVRIKEPVKFAAINLKTMPVQNQRAYSVGYNQVLEDDKIGAVGNINSDDFDFSLYNNVFELIKGRIPGVELINNEIIVRGVKSVHGSNAATIIVDGHTQNVSYLHSLQPSQVKNISVIKDGSAAIYGFQGSNGVVIIETTMGK